MTRTRIVASCLLLSLGACTGEEAPPSHVGEVLDPAMAWSGYPAGSVELGEIALGDYLDVDGQRGIHALLLVEARASCPACQQEAAEMPLLSARWHELGIAVVHLLFNETTSKVATTETALEWKTAFDADWAVAVDPEFTFGSPSTTPIPLNLLVDPRSLTIVGQEEGYGEAVVRRVEELAVANQP